MNGARCAQCSIGGAVKQRKANTAVWIVYLIDGTTEPACDRHARQFCGREGNWALGLSLPIMDARTFAGDEPSVRAVATPEADLARLAREIDERASVDASS